MTVLTNVLKLTTKEKENHKVQNLTLVNKQMQVRAELDNQIDATQQFKEEATKLKSKIEQYGNSLKTHKEVEANLEAVIVTQKTELHEQEQKFSEAGNPGYDILMKLKDLGNTKLQAIGRTLKESRLKEVNDNNKKLDQVINENRTMQNPAKISCHLEKHRGSQMKPQTSA